MKTNTWKERIIQWLINSIAPTIVIGIFVFFMKTDTGMSVNANELNNMKQDITNLNAEVNEVEATKADKLEVIDKTAEIKEDVKEIKGDVKELRSIMIQSLTISKYNKTQLIKFDTLVNGKTKKKEN